MTYLVVALLASAAGYVADHLWMVHKVNDAPRRADRIGGL